MIKGKKKKAPEDILLKSHQILLVTPSLRNNFQLAQKLQKWNQEFLPVLHPIYLNINILT